MIQTSPYKGVGVKKGQIFVDVLYRWPPTGLKSKQGRQSWADDHIKGFQHQCTGICPINVGLFFNQRFDTSLMLLLY